MTTTRQPIEVAPYNRSIQVTGLKDAKTSEAIAYAAPVAGSWFFYIPMWSILPGIYGKYFGIPLTAIAAVVLFIRLFDGVIDTTTGYLSDWHRSTGGSRKPWVVVGNLGSIVACYFLFTPPQPATTTYYLLWSMAYFLAFTIAEIPHLTWGSELTPNYQRRAQVYGIRNMFQRSGMIVFYVLPLLPIYSLNDYTPEVLSGAVYVGSVMTILGLAWMLLRAPAGISDRVPREESLRSFVNSLIHNRPLLIYFAAFASVGLCYGMWFALVYIYLDSYLLLGGKVAMMFLFANVTAVLSTPLWLELIRRHGKSSAWAVGVSCFALQLIGTWFIRPGDSWWISLTLVVIANLCFCCHDVAAMSILGDIVDYGKLKFRRDRGTTYFAFNTLIFKIGLGLGGGLALGITGFFGFNPSITVQSSVSIVGLKLGFIVLPACLAITGLFVILRVPIDKRRHQIIQRRLLLRQVRAIKIPSDSGIIELRF